MPTSIRVVCLSSCCLMGLTFTVCKAAHCCSLNLSCWITTFYFSLSDVSSQSGDTFEVSVGQTHSDWQRVRRKLILALIISQDLFLNKTLFYCDPTSLFLPYLPLPLGSTVLSLSCVWGHCSAENWRRPRLLAAQAVSFSRLFLWLLIYLHQCHISGITYLRKNKTFSFLLNTLRHNYLIKTLLESH